jgi:hypothetical protein
LIFFNDDAKLFLFTYSHDSPPPYTPTPNNYQNNALPPLPPRVRVTEQTGYLGSAPPEKRGRQLHKNSDYDQGYSGSSFNMANRSNNIEPSPNVSCSDTGSIGGASLDSGYRATRTTSTLSLRGSVNSGRSNSARDSNKSSSKLYIKQSNSPLELSESWTGRECQLKNTNGNITVHGSLNANRSIQLENHNGTITIDGQLLATKDIYIKVNNGAIVIHGESIISKNLTIENNNSPLQFNNFIEAKKIYFKTKNAPVTLNNISVGSQLYAKTTNSPVDIFINDIGSVKEAKIGIETTNAPVNVYVPSKYAGKFEVKSKYGTAMVVAKSIDKSMLTFTKEENENKTGIITRIISGGNKTDSAIVIKTTNAPATLYIQ